MNLRDRLQAFWFWLWLHENDIVKSYHKRDQEHMEDVDPQYFDLMRMRRTLIPPNISKVWGFDCSHWSGPVDMQTAVDNGAKFVFIKAADGTVRTKWFDVNYPAALDKLYRAPYFWLYPGSKVSLTAQASAWWNIITLFGMPDLPPVIDYEWTYYGGYPANPTNSDLNGVLDAFLALSGGLKPLVYTSVGYVGEVGAITQSIIDKTAGVWAAHYGVDTPAIPKNYTGYLFHQFTDQMDGAIVGYDPAYSKAADGDYFNGTQAELDALAGGDPPLPPPPVDPPTDTNYTNGVRVERGRLYGSDYETVIIPPASINSVGFVATGDCHLVDDVVGDIVYNWTPSEVGACVPNMGVRSGGKELYPLNGNFNPYVGWWDSNICHIDHMSSSWGNLPVASQGYRYVIADSAKGPTSSAWDNTEPRRLIGSLPDGSTVIISTKGRAADQKGWTLHEAAEYGLSIDMDYMIDGDSGKSVRTIIRDQGGEKIFTGTGDNEPVPVIGVIDFKEPLVEIGSEPVDEIYEGTALYRIGIWRTPELLPTLAGTLAKGRVRTGTLIEGDGLLWLKFKEKRFVPVRALDGSAKYMTLKKVSSPPPSGGLYRVKMDQETDRWGFKIRDAAPAPAVWVLSETAYKMDAVVQFFCADLLALSKYGRKFNLLGDDDIAQAFTGVYRSDAAFTNRTGFACNKFPTERRNYIKDENPDAELPRFDKIRVCSGAVIRGVEDGADLVVDHFTEVPTNYGIEILSDPRVFRATIIKTDGTLINFPQLKDGSPVYVPIIAANELRIPLKWVEKL